MPILNLLQQNRIHTDPGSSFFVSRLGSSPGDTQVNEPTDVIPGAISTTYTIAIGGTETGVVNFTGDDDYFRVELVAGQTYTFTLTGSGPNPLQDTYLELRNSAGTIVAVNDDINFPSNTNSRITFTATTTGTYYLNARAYEDPNESFTGGYTLTANILDPGDLGSPLDAIEWAYTMPGTTLEVYFAVQGETWNGDTAVRNWTQAEINAVFAALGTFSAVTPLVFTQTFSSAGADIVLTLADLGDALGQFWVGTPYGAFDPSGPGWDAGGLAQGGYGFVTIIHEIGHGLGLAHPHDNGGGSEIMAGVDSPFGSYGLYNLNQGVFTMMSYNSGWELSPNGIPSGTTFGYEGTPMALDIAVLQQRYGVNPTTGAGVTNYTLGTTNNFYRAIWDVSGVDTISFGGSAAATIDLRAATLEYEAGGGGFISYVSGVHGGFTIANGVVIENATGGSGADTLIGNSAANQLRGNGGADNITGGLGIDTAVYSGASTSASWHRNIDGSWTVTADGTDTLNSVEFLDFTDRDVFLDRAVTNFSGDGTSDIIIRRFSDGVTAIFTVNGATVTSAALTQIQSGAAWSMQGFGDFNLDGRDDILLRRTADGVTGVWTMNGTTVEAFNVTNWQATNAWQIQAVGDFNRDGVDDLLWRRTSDGVTAIWQMNGSTVTTGDVTLWQASNDWTIQGVGDFNSDGRDDFLWRRSDGTMAIWNMDGTNVISADVTSQQAGVEWIFSGAGDFNGDGRDDILLRRADGAIAVWTMNNTNVTSAALTSQFAGSAWQVAAVGDYNGDGRDDILLRADADGTLALWTMNGATVTNVSLLSQQAGADWGVI